MAEIHDWIRNRLLAQKGLLFDKTPPKPSYESLAKTEWSPVFERLMRNRLIMGALRYGLLEEKRKKPGKWDLLGAITKKIICYQKTGNTEYLVDIANYCLLEFEVGAHPKKHFHALDDHHDHCKQTKTK